MYTPNTIPPESDLEWPLFQKDMRETISGEPNWRSELIIVAFFAWKKGRSHIAPIEKDQERLVPRTLGGFRGSFYVINGRQPTEQEVFDAGMKAGRDIQWYGKNQRQSILGDLLPEGLTDKQKLIVLEDALRLALMAFKKIAVGHANPAEYAKLTIKHLDTPSSQYLLTNELSKQDVEDLFDAIVSKTPHTGEYPADQPVYMNVRLSEIFEFVQELLKKSKL